MIHVYRTVLVTAVLAALVLVGFWQLKADADRRALAAVQALNAELEARLVEREAMIGRLSRTRRVAHIRVGEQTSGPDGGIATTALEFIELDDAEGEIARQSFEISGDVLFVDALTIKFDPEDVAIGHVLRDRTLILFRRIYSDLMPPSEGLPIDTPGSIPPAYAGSESSRYEQQLWENFWKLASDPEFAADFGVRVAQGEAVYKPIVAGMTYDLVVDAVGGMNLTVSGAEESGE